MKCTLTNLKNAVGYRDAGQGGAKEERIIPNFRHRESSDGGRNHHISPRSRVSRDRDLTAISGGAKCLRSADVARKNTQHQACSQNPTPIFSILKSFHQLEDPLSPGLRHQP